SSPTAQASAGMGTAPVAGLTTPVAPYAAGGLGCSDFARHYLRNHYCFIFLQVRRWFTSRGSLLPAYGFSGPYAGFTSVGFPIRTSPVDNACLRLAGAFRSLPRPSSPSPAKASTMRP